MSIASWTSPRASARTFPISRVTIVASDSFSLANRSAARNRISPRLGAGIARHAGHAARAAATASSPSRDDELGATATTSRVSAGLTLVSVSPDADGVQRPLMRLAICSAMSASSGDPPAPYQNLREDATPLTPRIKSPPPLLKRGNQREQ